MALGLVREHVRGVLSDPQREVVDPAQRPLQVVAGDVGELVQLAVAPLEFGRPLADAFGQLGLGRLLGVDVRRGPEPPGDGAVRVQDGDEAGEEPPVLPVGPEEAELGFERKVRRNRHPRVRRDDGQVVRMDDTRGG